MVGDNQYPEIAACLAAKKALEEYDATHKAKEQAIKTLAAMLHKGGWASVKFDCDSASIPPRQRIPEDIESIPIAALGPPSVIEIVVERRQLLDRWKSAYAAVPEEIRAAAPAPPAVQAKRLDRRHR